jgi:hypothetical protein
MTDGRPAFTHQMHAGTLNFTRPSRERTATHVACRWGLLRARGGALLRAEERVLECIRGRGRRLRQEERKQQRRQHGEHHGGARHGCGMEKVRKRVREGRRRGM